MNNSIIDKFCIKCKRSYPELFFALLFLRPIYLRFFLNLSVIFGFNTNITTNFYYGVMWLLLGASLFKCTWKITKRYLGFIFGLTLIILIDILFWPNSVEYIISGLGENLIIFSSTSLVGSFFFFFIGGMIQDYNIARVNLHIISRIGIIMAITADYISLFLIGEKPYDDMAYAYGVCLLVCDILFELLEKRQKIDIVFCILGFISLLVSGTRGPFVCVAIVFVIWTFIYQKKIWVKVLAITIVLIAIVFVYTDIFKNLLVELDKALESVGISNLRIIDYIYANSLTDTSGREEIYGLVWEKLLERPITGYGIGGDRIYITGGYAHNIIFEILFQFGFFVGGAILGFLGYWCIRSICEKNHDLATLSIVLVSSIVIKLFFSSSYIFSYELFLFLGMYLNSKKSKIKGMWRNNRKVGYDMNSS